MELLIDYREKELIELLNATNQSFTSENLELGDIVFKQQNNERIIFERKTLYDLAASIKDGRYQEQSFRLNNCATPTHNIFYIIEGNMNSYNISKGRMDKKTLYSAMFAIQFYKGFSLIKTNNIQETMIFIYSYFQKMQKEFKKPGHYEPQPVIKKESNIIQINTSIEKSETNTQPTSDIIASHIEPILQQETSYNDVIKRSKKSNITKENIAEIMISNIPGVSSKSANIIMQKYKTLEKLIEALKQDKLCLNNLQYETSNGQLRKINKTCGSNIIEYLICEHSITPTPS